MSLANLLNATAGGLNQGCWKRKGSEEDEDVIPSTVKKAKYSWYVTLESESSQPTSPDEDDESIHSVQAQETEYVQDTSDTSRNTWIGSSDNGDVVHVEYEVASISGSDDNPFIDGISSSDPEEIIRVGMIAAGICDTDDDKADYSSDDSRSSRDSELSHADYWTCMQCNTSNNNPMFRCCEKCWRERKNFFPPRPKGKKRRRKLEKSKQSQVLESHDLTAVDSGLGSSQSSQPFSRFPFKQMEMEIISSRNIGKDRGTSFSLSQESTSTIDVGFSASQASTVHMSQSSEIDFSQPGTSFMSQTSEIDSSQATTSSHEKFSSLSKNATDRLETLPTSSQGHSLSKNETDRLEISEERSSSKNEENRLEKATEDEHFSQESMLSVATTLSIDSRLSEEMGSGKNYQTKDSSIDETKTQSTADPDNKLCEICTTGPRNGVFVHGQTAHIRYCYGCAKKMWKTIKHCPLCNRKVVNVVKAYYA